MACFGVFELGMIVIFSNKFPTMLPILAYTAFVGFAGWALWRPSAGSFFHSRQKGGS
jgi:hypothetical protein